MKIRSDRISWRCCEKPRHCEFCPDCGRKGPNDLDDQLKNAARDLINKSIGYINGRVKAYENALKNTAYYKAIAQSVNENNYKEYIEKYNIKEETLEHIGNTWCDKGELLNEQGLEDDGMTMPNFKHWRVVRAFFYYKSSIGVSGTTLAEIENKKEILAIIQGLFQKAYGEIE